VVSEQELGHAIDVVAREMTAADVPESLRAQVLDRIELERRRPGFVLPRWAWAGAAAIAVLAVATATWLNGPQHTLLEQASIARPTAAPGVTAGPRPRAESVPDSPVVLVASSDAHAAPAAARRRPALDRQEAALAGAAEDAGFVRALAEIQPLGLHAIEPAALEVQGVEVLPLDDIPMIDIPGLNPGSVDTRPPDPQKEP
jgi:hypothetical protein